MSKAGKRKTTIHLVSGSVKTSWTLTIKENENIMNQWKM